MSRARILADTIARLEVERFSAPIREPRTSRHCEPPRALTPEQTEHNRAVLCEAIGLDHLACVTNLERSAS